jgi:HSP90 family molecular chaperone
MCSNVNTTSISEQLCSSKYQFLYEVIQNADDSHYDNLESTRSQSFLRLVVTPKTFVIETNEDGFNRKNVEAICATGKSSKKGSSSNEYTGEKGFGFKSVFSIADEVRIQSGLWSFRFEHDQGDDGLGMVTPLDATTDELPIDITTRIILRLTPKADQEYKKLLNAVLDVPDTTLFFLRKLSTVRMDLTRIIASSCLTQLTLN